MTTDPADSTRAQPAVDPGPDDPATASLDPQRELPRFFGLALYGLMIAGVVLLPVVAVVALLFQLPYFAALFGVLFFLALGGVFLLEILRLRGWRFSFRELIAAWLALFIVGALCATLGYKQYRLTWAAERAIAVESWADLSQAQRHLLAEELVAGRIRPTLAELLDFRQHADFQPRVVIYRGRFVQEFAYAIGPWKLLGQECLVIRIDRDRQDPIYTIEAVDTVNWKPEP